MIYAVCLMDLTDFGGIGRQMPKGTGVDATIADGSKAPKHVVKRRTTNSSSSTKREKRETVASAIREGVIAETKLSALKLLIQFGSETEKKLARNELLSIALSGKNRLPDLPEIDSDSESISSTTSV